MDFYYDFPKTFRLFVIIKIELFLRSFMFLKCITLQVALFEASNKQQPTKMEM